MSNLRRRHYLKKKFEDGDNPDGNDFAELIDSSLNQKSDQIFAVDQQLGIGTNAPTAPLEVKGSSQSQRQSVVVADGCNSTLRIAHPQNNVVAVGCDSGELLQLGNFNSQNGNFTPELYISESGVGVGAEAKNATLDVNTTFWVGESIGLGDATLYFEDGLLYMKTDTQTELILTKKVSDKPKPFRKWILVLIILACIFFALVIALIIIYLINTYGQ